MMAQHHHQSDRSSASIENELWFSMSGSGRRQQDSSRIPEHSAYQAANYRLSTGSTSSTSTRTSALIPSIYTPADTNKPLPPSPTESERTRRKPAYLRSLLARVSPSHLDPTHLQPQPYPSYHSAQRNSTTSSSLSLDTQSSYHHVYSRSMPSSPYDYDQTVNSLQPISSRASSATTQYSEIMEYQPYKPPPQQHSDASYFTRSSSLNTYHNTTPPRARTFPAESSIASPTMRDGLPNRPRPHTWLSPTDSFSDPSQFSLFAQATTGLLNDAEPFSPSGPPQLRGSLFARRSENDVIPLPFQKDQARVSREVRTDWQNFEPPPFLPQTASGNAFTPLRNEPVEQLRRTPHMTAVNRELEILGIDGDEASDDELPNYAQSQAEERSRRRAEASARARELEAQWRNTRST